MRRFFLISMALVLFSTALWAQAAKPTTKASDHVTFSADIKVGSVTLKAGDYLVVCDTKQATFQRAELSPEGDWAPIRGQKPVTVTYRGQPLPEKKHSTELDVAVDASGARVLQKLYLQGSNVEYDFSAAG